MNIILIAADNTTDEGFNDLNGLKIFGSCSCTEHRQALIIARPAGKPLDIRCAISLLDDMRRKLLARTLQ